jgi:acetate kinase
MREKAMDATTLEDLLNNKSGLLGMSGISDDMRDLLNSTAPDAETAVGLFVHRIIEAMGSLIAEMEGLDAIIFTAGIGENNPEIRARILKKLSWLGIEMDEKNNAANAVWLTNKKSKIPALALKTNEELMIAKETKALLS